MRKQTGRIVIVVIGLSVLLAVAPVNKAHAGTTIFGWDVGATYFNLKQAIMEKVFGTSLPQIPVTTNPIQEDKNEIEDDMNQEIEGSSVNPKNPDSFVRLTFTQNQVNDLINSELIGRNLGNGLVVKSGKLEFLDDSKIGLIATISTANEGAKNIEAFAMLTVVENGTRLKVDSLDIEGMGIMAKVVKPMLIKYFEGQQEALIKRYAPADFSFAEVKSGLVDVYLSR
jgi:hypothetical protein